MAEAVYIAALKAALFNSAIAKAVLYYPMCHRLPVEREMAKAEGHILVGAGDEGLLGLDVVHQHGAAPPAAHVARRLGYAGATVRLVHHRQAPGADELPHCPCIAL